MKNAKLALTLLILYAGAGLLTSPRARALVTVWMVSSPGARSGLTKARQPVLIWVHKCCKEFRSFNKLRAEANAGKNPNFFSEPFVPAEGTLG